MIILRAVFISALAALLVGCAAVAKPDLGVDQRAKKSKSVQAVKASKPAKSSTAARGNLSLPKRTKSPLQRIAHQKAMVLPTTPGDVNVAVLRAKRSIAELMDRPESAKFSNLIRANKKLSERPVDTICGSVRGTNAAGEDTGEMPFLFIVGHDREDEAYLVHGRSHVAETVHKALCP